MRFLRKLMKLLGYDLSLRDLFYANHRSHNGLNYRSAASHRLTRRRENILGKFKSARHL